MPFYKCTLVKSASGVAMLSTSNETEINLGFKPKYVCVIQSGTTPAEKPMMSIYNADIATNSYKYAASSTYSSTVSMPSTTTNRINSITDTGFIMTKCGSTYPQIWYFAVG